MPPGTPLDPAAAARIPPARRVGAPVPHAPRMLSLDKAYDVSDLMAWADKFEGDILVMPKHDGVACSLRWLGGRLVLAATRGSGTVGEDVTRTVLQIPGLPHHIDGADLEVRGEVYVRRSAFATVADQFANPRNLAAGLLKHKAPDPARTRLLSFAAYDLLGTPATHEREKFAHLARLNIPRVDHEFITRDQIEDVILRMTARRDQLDYEIDGVVLRADRVDEQARMGSTEHHPRFAIAFKFQGETGQTHLQDVTWSVSRSGTITPVAIVAPVTLSGATISRASLANLSRFRELALRPGDLVEVTRRGGVIPYVERVRAHADRPPFTPPERCPACGAPAVVRVKREGEFLQCSQPEQCVQARMGELEHFAKSLDMLGFGPKVIATLVDAGLLSAPEDFFRLRATDMAGLPRLGDKSAHNLLTQIERARKLPLDRFLVALGIEHLGPKTARVVAEHFGTLARLRAASAQDLTAIKGIKDAIADGIVAGLARQAARIDALLAHVEVEPAAPPPAAPTSEADGPLAGRSFLFTGALARATRKQAQAAVQALGGTVASGVSKSLGVLVVGGPRDKASSKLRKAQALREAGAAIEILDEDAFWALIASAGGQVPPARET